MPADVATGGARAQRRARYLIPRGLPRRAEFVAACAVALVLAHAVFAQLTLVCAVACFLTGKAARWRASWLLAPLLAALVWTLAVGPAAAVAGYVAGPASILRYFGGSGHLLHPFAAFAGAGSWLPRQLPIALAAGTAEAALAAWLNWLHTDEWNLPRARPGLLAGVRRVVLRRAIRYGAIVTRDGACLGVASGSGAKVELTWAEAEGGVLVCGSAQAEPLATSLQLVSAALRRRKPVLVLDLTGGQGARRALAASCAAAGVPLRVFGGTGGQLPDSQPCSYEPFRYGDPVRRAMLVTGMLTWDAAAEQHRRSCVAYLTDMFELLDAAPGDPRVPVLDEVIHLLDPAALRARAAHIPAGYPRLAVLTERVTASSRVLAADPAAVSTLIRQLRALRAAPAGRWLGRPVGVQVAELDLREVVSGRSAALFSLDGADDATRTILARLVVLDLLRLAADLPGLGVSADGVVWLAGCLDGAPGTSGPGTAAGDQAVGELIAAAPRAGLAVLATARSAGAACSELFNALVIHSVSEPAAARRLAALAGPRIPVAGAANTELPAAVAADDLLNLADSEFLLAVRSPRRLVRRARAIRAERAVPAWLLDAG